LIYIRYGYIIPAMVKRGTRAAPLTPAVLHILLALSTQERHGYGIMKQVESDSQGKVRMGPGTLYGSIGRMIQTGLVRESDKRIDPEMDDARRVYYRITGAGRKARIGPRTPGATCATCATCAADCGRLRASRQMNGMAMWLPMTVRRHVKRRATVPGLLLAIA